jgi:hypothetical protein
MTAPEPERTALAQQADELARSVRQLNDSVVALRDSQRRVKQAVAWTIAGLVGVLLLSLIVAGVAVQANAASERASDAAGLANQNRQAAKVTCEAGNDARDAQVRLWTYVLDLSDDNPNLTAAQRKRIEDFRVYINTVFAHRDCSDPQNPTVLPPTTTPTR